MQLGNLGERALGNLNNFVARFTDKVTPVVTKYHDEVEHVSLSQQDLVGTPFVRSEFTQHHLTPDDDQMERLRQNSKNKEVFCIGSGRALEKVEVETQAGYTLRDGAKTPNGRPAVSIQSSDETPPQAFEGYLLSVPGIVNGTLHSEGKQVTLHSKGLIAGFENAAQVRVGQGEWAPLQGRITESVSTHVPRPLEPGDQGRFSSALVRSIREDVAKGPRTELSVDLVDRTRDTKECIIVTGNEVAIHRTRFGDTQHFSGSVLDDGSIQFIDPDSKQETAYRFPISPKVLAMI